MQKKKQPAKTSWGKVASWYDELLGGTNTYQQEVILPKLLHLMHLRSGERVLDLACGQGFFSHSFAKAGANVTGIDISSELIAKAKSTASAKEAFIVSSADKLTTIDSSYFDTVVIILALQNIENMKGVLAEVYRVLKSGGHFFIVLNHPAFRIPGKADWGFDEVKKVQYRRIEKYLSDLMIKIDMHPGVKEKQKEYTVSFHRPISAFINGLSQEKFDTVHMEEWISHKKSQLGPRQKAEDIARHEIPLFLCIEAVKKS